MFQRIDVNGCGSGCETDEIDAVSSDGSGLRRLAYDPPGKGCIKGGGRPAGGICRAVPAWSPDGRRIAFQCQVQPSAGDQGYSRICLMDADGSNVRQWSFGSPPSGIGSTPTSPSVVTATSSVSFASWSRSIRSASGCEAN